MKTKVLFWSLSLALLSACASTGGTTQADPSVAPGANERFATPEGRAASVNVFEASERDQYQKPAEVIRNLELREGDVVCEVGAGSGYFTPYLSKAVGRTGRVYAQDPQREFLELIRQKKEHMGLTNVEVVLSTYTDTNLPDDTCDVAFVLDTYHHFEWPPPMLDAMKRDLKQGGRLVIVDWYRRQNAIFDKLGIKAADHMRLDLDGVVAEVTRNGWNHVDTRTFLDYQFFAVFTPR
jgi:ubiquinone/menaquinone biosynthesis C-methylase UbiE